MARSRSSKMPSPESRRPLSSRPRSLPRSASQFDCQEGDHHWHRLAADSKASSFLTTDNVQAGRVAADGLAAAIEKKYGKPGDIALITSIPGVGSLDARERFQRANSGQISGVETLSLTNADGMATTGLNMMTDLITANPNLRGVFTSNLIMTQGAGQAIAENKVADKIMLYRL